jgi:hypothetical protein
MYQNIWKYRHKLFHILFSDPNGCGSSGVALARNKGTSKVEDEHFESFGIWDGVM